MRCPSSYIGIQDFAVRFIDVACALRFVVLAWSVSGAMCLSAVVCCSLVARCGASASLSSLVRCRVALSQSAHVMAFEPVCHFCHNSVIARTAIGMSLCWTHGYDVGL